ncbi:MAG: hypothetical protein AAGF59_04445 [Pseudomonadota bacterium]
MNADASGWRLPFRWPRTRPLAVAAVAMFVCGAGTAALLAATILAGPLGLGHAEDFVLYRWFALSRSEAARGFLAAGIVCAVLTLVLLFDPRRLALVKEAVYGTGLLAASLLIGLVMIEAGFRVLNDIPFWPIENHIAREQALLNTQTANAYDPDLGWVLKPGIASNPQDQDTSFTTGDLGIRMNSSTVRPLPKGAILAVGDSFTAGSEVGDRHSWPAQLESMVGEPVVNGGVGGWAADQIVLRAEKLAPVLEPHTIVISFLADDILRAGFRVYGSANKPWFDLDGDDKLVRHNDPVPVFSGKPSEIGFSPIGYFHIATFVADRLGFGDWLRRGDQNIRNGNDPVAVSCKLLERAHKRFSADGRRTIFLLQHGGDDRHDRTSQKPHADKVVACARAAGIETIDTWPPLLEEFRQGPDVYRRLFVMHDNGQLYGHMSPEGNALIARLVAEKLGK